MSMAWANLGCSLLNAFMAGLSLGQGELGWAAFSGGLLVLTLVTSVPRLMIGPERRP
jgi:hypothetical protein